MGLNFVRATLALGLTILLAACGGGGGGGGELAPPPSSSGVVVTPGSGIASASLGDAHQRIFVMPGEATERSVSIVRSEPEALFDVTVATGTAMIATSTRGGRHFISIDSTSLTAGSTHPYKVVIRNRASSASAEISGEIVVLTPQIVATASIGEAGGAISTQNGDMRIEFGPQPGAAPLGVTVRAASAPSGVQWIRVKFDRDISTDSRSITFAETQSSAVGRATALASERRPRAASFPTSAWDYGIAYYLDGSNYRTPRSAILAQIGSVSCSGQGNSEICVTARRAWELTAPSEEGLRIATERNAVPVLFVHGYQPNSGAEITENGGADYWGEFPQRLQELDGRVVPFEFRWYTNARFEDVADELAAAIRLIYLRTGSKRVTIVAHSFGGILSRTMLQGLGTLNVSLGDKVEQLITLGTPHSGIADKAATMHSVSLPGGQDSGAFEFCGQISCHQMGERVGDIADNVVLANLLKVSIAQGQLASDLSTSSLPTNVNVAVGIGLALEDVFGGYRYRNGDSLISWAGQRLRPADGLRGPSDPQYLDCQARGIEGKKEVLLDGGDGREPNKSLSNAEYSDPKRGHAHSRSTLKTTFAEREHNVLQAELRAKDCAAAGGCTHASFELVKAALVDGICRAPVITGQSPRLVSVGVGEAASLTVNAVSAGPLGSGALTYQWLRSPDMFTGPSAIPGATGAKYELPSVALTDNGWVYWVQVKDSDGATTISKEIELRVSAAPPPPAAECGAQAVTWTQGASTCNASYGGGKSGTSALLSDLAAPTTGTVTASCTAGVLSQTSPACATAPTPPPGLIAPTSLAPSGTITSLTPVFSWSGGSGAANYEINVRDQTTNTIVLRQQGISAASTSFTMPAGILVNERPYRWDITACPDFACSAGYVTSADLTFFTNAPPASAPDLIAQGVVFEPGTVTVGGMTLVTFSITNTGATTTRTSSAAVRITPATATSPEGANLRSEMIPGLATGGSVTRTVALNVPTADGAYKIWVVADVNDRLGQSAAAKANDAAAAALPLTVVPRVTPLGGTAEGAYGGTMTGGPNPAFRMLVLEDGEFWSLYGFKVGGELSVTGFIQGRATSGGGSLSASDVKDFGFFPAVGGGTISGTYDAAVGTLQATVLFPGLTVNVAGGPVRDVPFEYDQPASLPSIVGTWALMGNTGDRISLNIATSGAFTATSASGCSFSGTVAPRPSGKNVLNASLQFGASPCLLPGQRMTGVAVTHRLQNGRTQLTFAGVNASRTAGLLAAGAR
jgi:pimeloyl-ACP methyl ester carboxylesterase